MRGYQHVATDVPSWILTAANRVMGAAAMVLVDIADLVPDASLTRYISTRLRALSEVLSMRYTTAAHSDPEALTQEALEARVNADRDKATALAKEIRAAIPQAALSVALVQRLDHLETELFGGWMINFEEEFRRG